MGFQMKVVQTRSARTRPRDWMSAVCEEALRKNRKQSGCEFPGAVRVIAADFRSRRVVKNQEPLEQHKGVLPQKKCYEPGNVTRE